MRSGDLTSGELRFSGVFIEPAPAKAWGMEWSERLVRHARKEGMVQKKVFLGNSDDTYPDVEIPEVATTMPVVERSAG